MSDTRNLKGKFLFLGALVGFSVFLMIPKPEDWSTSDNKFCKKIAALTTRAGIDLQGGTRLEYEVPEKSRPQFEGTDSMTRLVHVLATRIDKTGVLEPNISITGKFRFVIELPGVSPDVVERVKGLIQRQGKLELKLVANLDGDADLSAEDERVRAQIADLEKNFPIDGERVVDRAQQGELVANAINQQVLSKRYASNWKYYFWYEERVSGGITDQFLLVENPVIISGTDIKSAYRTPSQFGAVPAFTLNAPARSNFCNATRKHVSNGDDPRSLAIILDDHLVSSPSIKSEICDGSAIIDGTYAPQEVDDLVNVFTSGSLPVVPELMREETTGPSIGVAAQRASILAGVIGTLSIIIFMFVYYMGAGVVANVALVINGTLLGGMLMLFGCTITLPGVAGLILTVGMAVDANILIYERIREESEKGKTLVQAIANGYDRAFITIFDSNLTTLITAAVLYYFGTGTVAGFALTLSVGIITSMFCALFVTRLIFDTLEARGLLTELKMRNWVGRPKIDFMRWAPFNITLSFVLVGIGIVLFLMRFDAVQGIDLKGGTEFRVSSATALSGTEVSATLKAVNGKINGWIEDGSWPTVAGLVIEPGAPAPEAPAHNPLKDVRPQGLNVDYNATNRPQPDSGSYYEYMVRSRTLGEESYVLVQRALEQGGEGILPLQITEKTEISSKIARETAVGAIIAVLFSIGAILLYITMRFEFQFGLGAIVAEVHDVALMLGAISLANMTNIVDVEMSLPIIAAILLVIGYSINDTIVAFDRIRENMKGGNKIDEDAINGAINQTLSRTVLTSATTMVTAIVLFVLNYGRGNVIEGFSFVLIVGILFGTYSSIYVASPIVIYWQRYVKTRQDKAMK